MENRNREDKTIADILSGSLL